MDVAARVHTRKDIGINLRREDDGCRLAGPQGQEALADTKSPYRDGMRTAKLCAVRRPAIAVGHPEFNFLANPGRQVARGRPLVVIGIEHLDIQHPAGNVVVAIRQAGDGVGTAAKDERHQYGRENSRETDQTASRRKTPIERYQCGSGLVVVLSD